MAQARAVGADRVELYTEPYAAAWGTERQAAELERYRPPPRPRWTPGWASTPATT
jgi:pyridoxine 5-phosphate synthase